MSYPSAAIWPHKFDREDAKTVLSGFFGLAVVAVGVSLLTLNERRNTRQRDLRELARAVCVPLDMGETKYDPAQLGVDLRAIIDEQVVLATAFLSAEGPEPPHYVPLYLAAPRALRMRFSVEMYQWQEFEHISTKTVTGADGKHRTETTRKYSFSPVWSPRHLSTPHSPYPRNPDFPAELCFRAGPDGFCEAPGGGTLRWGPAGLGVSPDLFQRLQAWVPLELTSEVLCQTGGSHQLPAGLALAADRKTFTSARLAQGAAFPWQGDLRVRFEVLEEGMHTAVAQLASGPGGCDDEQLQWQADCEDTAALPPFHLRQYLEGPGKPTLRGMAEVKAPDAANDLARAVGLYQLSLPARLLEAVELMLLGAAPIEVSLLEKGRISMEQAFGLLEAKHARSTNELRSIGLALCVAGALQVQVERIDPPCLTVFPSLG